MSSFNWERFLKRWSQEIIGSIGESRRDLPPDVLKSGWLGYPGATEQQIASAEARLGKTLPPSYRAFLKVTNGWRQTPLFSNTLWSVAEIEWFAVRHQAWIDAFWKKTDQRPSESSNAKAPTPSTSDADYFVYGDEQDCSKIRIEYLQTALEISQRGDGVIYLLNPQIVTPDGEWEAWFFGDWLPGADRYRSFQDMMQAEYENFLELREPANAAAPIAEAAVARKPAAVIKTVIETAIAPAATTPEPASTASVSAMEAWQTLASFTIECQTRPGHDEQRTMIRDRATDTVEIRPDSDTAAMQQWMLTQLKGCAEHTQAEEPVEVEITQLRVIRSPQTEQSMVANQVQPLFSEAIQHGEPFALEVSMNVVGATAARLAERQLIYRAQCIAHHLSTRLDTDLGDITTRLPGGNQAACIAQFPEARLQQPGLYRLKVWVTLQNASASPGYFKVPLLHVV
jgi:hypothetical protein